MGEVMGKGWMCRMVELHGLLGTWQEFPLSQAQPCRNMLRVSWCSLSSDAYSNTCHQVWGSEAGGNLSFREAVSGGQPASYHPPPQNLAVEG